MNCRFCGAGLSHVFADLGCTPLANSFRSEEQLSEMEPFYPLRAMVCDQCFLVQLDACETPETIFSEYAYFSSYSKSWLEHSKAYAEMAIQRFGLDQDSEVVELGSNDGYLLQYFLERGIPAMGVEPAQNVASVSVTKGIRTMVGFFGRSLAQRIPTADLVVANNVLAHVPDINDFVGGVKDILAPGGRFTMEFPHLMNLITDNEYDTIYHEHFSYFSFLTVQRIFAAHDLFLYDVEEIPTHGGSLRIYGRHQGEGMLTDRARELADRERAAGFEDIDTYLSFGESVKEAKWALLEELIAMRRDGKRIVGFGAPAKANTLFNYCGIGPDLIEFTVDETPYKQGRYLPGTHIPIRGTEALRETQPEMLFILPWNWRDEIAERFSYISEWGGQFLVGTPQLEVFA